MACCKDLEVSRMLENVDHPYTYDDAQFFINVVCAPSPSRFGWAVVNGASTIVGTISVEDIDDDIELGRCGTLGCWYGMLHWGKGFASEAAAAALRYAFDTVGLDAVRIGIGYRSCTMHVL